MTELNINICQCHLHQMIFATAIFSIYIVYVYVINGNKGSNAILGHISS